MSMSSNHSHDSVSLWLRRLKDQDHAAAQKIWERYFRRLVGLARKILNPSRSPAIDEEDVALSAFKSFYFRAVGKRFPQLNDRDDLWKLLMTITTRKACKVRQREQKRHAEVLPKAAAGRKEIYQPTREYVTAWNDEFRHLLELLPDERTKSVARLKFEGYKNHEIATKLGRSLSTIERKLQLIRDLWSEQLK